MGDDGYRFDQNMLGAAHGQCKAKYMAYLSVSPPEPGFVNLLIVDNTNITRGELEYYRDAADQNHATFISFCIDCRKH